MFPNGSIVNFGLRAKKNFRNINLSNVLSLILLHNIVKNSPPAEKKHLASTEVGETITLLHHKIGNRQQFRKESLALN